MFVISLKSGKAKIAILILFIVLFAILAAVFFASHSENKENGRQNEISLLAATNEERIAFLAQFGWKTDDQSTEVKEVLIPESFDEVYTDYNELQLKQGFDLSNYCGKRVKAWSYRVLNYPGYEEKPDLIRANLLVLDDCVIGGDISSVELNGFMAPFDPDLSAASIVQDPGLDLPE